MSVASLPAFTHHEIIGLVGPFTRAGRHVDLAASSRSERQLLFKAVERVDGELLAQDTLQLENPDPGHFVLTRMLATPGGLHASLRAEGADAGELLRRIEGVPVRRQLHRGAGFVRAFSHRFEGGGEKLPLRLILTRAEAQLDGFRLTMAVSRVTGIAGELALLPAAADTIALPDDLLAVLGWPWTRLQRVEQGWRSELRLRGSDAARGADAEAKFDRTAAHLAATFAEPPLRFHQTRLRARWVVVLRRLTPLLSSVGLIAAATTVPSLNLAQDSVLRMLIFHAPPLLLGALFCMRELPRIEIPPLPRPPAEAAWRRAS